MLNLITHNTCLLMNVIKNAANVSAICANWRSIRGNIYLCHCTEVCIGLITFEIHF